MLLLIGLVLYYLALPRWWPERGRTHCRWVRVIARPSPSTIGVNLLIIPLIWLIETLLVRVDRPKN